MNDSVALRIRLQDSQGSGCEIEARKVELSLSHGIFEIGPGKHLSFPSAKLEVFEPDGSRHFGIGEGFASFEDSRLSLITDRYSEYVSSHDIPSADSADSASICAVCGKELPDTLHCLSLKGKRIDLCCSHCSETFRRAASLVRSIYEVPPDGQET